MILSVSEALDDDRDALVTMSVDRLGNPMPPWRTPDCDPRFEITRLDYTSDAGLFGCAYCGHPPYGPTAPLDHDAYLGCSGEEEIAWLEWLRAQDIYPLPPLGKPVLP